MASPNGTTLVPPPSQPTIGPTSQANGRPAPADPALIATSPSQQPNGTTSSQPPPPPPVSTNPLTTTPLPPTSLTDPGLSRRPRDARLIHLLLSSLPLTAYTERVPLQLLDFAYRYTSSVLSDAQHLSAEGYATSAAGNTARANAASMEGSVSLAAVRLSVASRMNYQFRSEAVGKEALLEVASERNRVLLPRVHEGGGYGGGVRLPAEKWVMSGVGWGVGDEWVEEGEAGEGEEDEKMEDIFGGDDGADRDRDMVDA